MLNFIELDANSILPKYLQITNAIISNIANGNIKFGDQVPSINSLSKEFYLSRDTVERAYRLLKKQKVLVSVPGKGTYIAKTQLITKLNVLFFVNKLSPFKTKVYNAFVKVMGENYHVDLRSYHGDETLFVELLTKYKTAYDYYVIVPHFRTDDLSHRSMTAKAKKLINTLPKNNLVVLDSKASQIKGEFIQVYQDYENDMYHALESGMTKIEKYEKLTLVYPKSAFYPFPKEIVEGFTRFCSTFNFNYEIIEELTSDFQLQNKNLYITIEENDLVCLMNNIKKSNYKLGHDVGVISYNDTPLKQLLGITVISCDFDAIGTLAAKMIIQKKKERVKASFNLINRDSV